LWGEDVDLRHVQRAGQMQCRWCSATNTGMAGSTWAPLRWRIPLVCFCADSRLKRVGICPPWHMSPPMTIYVAGNMGQSWSALEATKSPRLNGERPCRSLKSSPMSSHWPQTGCSPQYAIPPMIRAPSPTFYRVHGWPTRIFWPQQIRGSRLELKGV
jgi:hypothetical protein